MLKSERKDPRYRNRLMIELRDDQIEQFRSMIPWGMQKIIFQSLVDGLINAYNKGGVTALTLITSNHLKIQELARLGEPLTHAYYSKEAKID